MAYEDLLTIYREAAIEYRVRRDMVPQACPHDGTPLAAGPRSVLYCPFGDFEYPRDRAEKIT